MSDNIKHISLSALAERIRVAVENNSGGEQWVVAEVSSVQVNYSGHCYIELVERANAQQLPSAVCRAVVWSSRYKMIAAYFRNVTGSDIVVGMKILVRCQPSYHPVYGLSLVINDIDPTYTVGEVERVRQQTVAQLQRDGVYDMNHEFALPAVVQRVAVVSSATAAGYGDFCDELGRSAYRFDVTLFQAVMQGEGAENSIIEALGQVAEDEFDAVVIIRGGGSVNDLACFDSYLLCSNIAQFPMPVITGIGHERDVSVADMVACHSLKTPTAVAAFMVERAAAFCSRLDKANQYVRQKSEQVVVNESRRVENASLNLQKIVRQHIHDSSININSLESSLRLAGTMFITRNSARCDTILEWIISKSTSLITEKFNRQRELAAQIRSLATTKITNETHRLELLQISVQASNPRRILKLGYAIVNGGLRSLEGVNIGDELSIEMSDGIIKAKVDDKWQTNS